MAIHAGKTFLHQLRQEAGAAGSFQSRPMLSHLLLAIVTIFLVIDLSDNYLSDDNYLSIMTRLLDVLG